jgi:putative copper resistance protein D
VAALFAFVSALAWADSLAVTMSGGWANALDPKTLRKVLFATQFGRVWVWQMLLALAMVLILLPRRRSGWLIDAAVAGIAAALLVRLADVSHAAMHIGTPGGDIHQLADRLHLLCAGFWIGGLAALAAMLVRAARNPSWLALVRHVLPRFSRAGYAAVALLLGTGIVNASFLIGPDHLLTTRYGLLLTAKICLFLLMVALALANRSMFSPKLIASRVELSAATMLHRTLLAELALGIAVLGSVSALGALPPPH